MVPSRNIEDNGKKHIREYLYLFILFLFLFFPPCTYLQYNIPKTQSTGERSDGRQRDEEILRARKHNRREWKMLRDRHDANVYVLSEDRLFSENLDRLAPLFSFAQYLFIEILRSTFYIFIITI